MSYRKKTVVILSRRSAAKDLSRTLDLRSPATHPVACEVLLRPSADQDDNAFCVLNNAFCVLSKQLPR